MKQTTPPADLFGDTLPTPETDNPTASMRALKVSAQQPGQKLTPEQQRFNKLLARIENLTIQMQELDQRVSRLQPLHQQALSALQQQIDDLQKRMLLQLHTYRQTLKLGKVQKRELTDTITSLLLQTEHLQDPDLLALFDQYFSPDEQAMWAEDEAASVQRLRELVQENLSADEQQDLPDDPETLMALLMKQMAAKQSTQKAASTEPPRPTARQQQAEQQALDAKATLRTLFRQLASALHPDRESDPAERERKTALMSQVNAAYEHQDLAAMLQLQLRTTALDAQSVARMTDEKLAAMSTLLKQQVSTLEAELRQAEARASMALGVAVSGKTTEAAIVRHLHALRSHLQETIDAMQADVHDIQDPVQFKAWLKAQRQLAKQQAAMERWMGDFL